MLSRLRRAAASTIDLDSMSVSLTGSRLSVLHPRNADLDLLLIGTNATALSSARKRLSAQLPQSWRTTLWTVSCDPTDWARPIHALALNDARHVCGSSEVFRKVRDEFSQWLASTEASQLALAWAADVRVRAHDDSSRVERPPNLKYDFGGSIDQQFALLFLRRRELRHGKKLMWVTARHAMHMCRFLTALLRTLFASHGRVGGFGSRLHLIFSRRLIRALTGDLEWQKLSSSWRP